MTTTTEAEMPEAASTLRHAEHLLREAAAELKDGISINGVPDWQGEPETAAAYEEHCAVADALAALCAAAPAEARPMDGAQEPVAIADGTFNCAAPIGTPLYAHPARPPSAAGGAGTVVAYRISDPNEPALGHWLSEQPGASWCKSEPLIAATSINHPAPQQAAPMQWRDEVQRLSEFASTAMHMSERDARNCLEDIAQRLADMLHEDATPAAASGAPRDPLQEFESARAKALMRAWEEGWEACRDSEFVGEEAQNDAFNRSETVNACIAEDQLPPIPNTSGAPVAAAPVSAEPSDRAAFQADWERSHYPIPMNTRMRDDGRYGDHDIQQAWEAWKAAPTSEQAGAARLDAADRLVLMAGFKSGDPGAARLAAQLAGVPACPGCDYVKVRCRCAAPASGGEAQAEGGVWAELQRLADCCPELNERNYDHSDVEELNAWAVEVAKTIDAARAIEAAIAAQQAAPSGATEQHVEQHVAYLDLGVGGYMDVGTDLTDDQLSALPKGRHMLAIVGTYGADGFVQVTPTFASGGEARVDVDDKRDAERYRWLGRKVSAHGIIDGWAFAFPTHLSLPAPALALRDPEAALGQAIDAAIAAQGERNG